MAVNKVVYDGATLVDLTGDTVTADNLAAGVKATGADGKPIVGLMQKVAIDAELSTTSTNPVQNKVIYNALLGKVGTDIFNNGFTLRGAITSIIWRQSSGPAGYINAATYTGTALYATQDSAGNVITDTYAKKADVSGMVKSVNNIKPDENGNVTISASGSNITVDDALSDTSTNPIQNKVVKTAIDTVTASIPTKVSALENDAEYTKTSTENVWTNFQLFHYIGINLKKYGVSTVVADSDMPTTSTAIYTVTSSIFTLDLTALFAPLMPGESTVFTAIFTPTADCPLNIINAGNIAYIGSASDIGISSSGTLLTIYMFITENNDMYSIVQASQLS